MTIHSTQQTRECGGERMSFCTHHADGSPVRAAGNNSFSMFHLMQQDDVRFIFRNLAISVRAQGINPETVRASVMTLRDFEIGFLGTGGAPFPLFATTDTRITKALKDEARWDERVGDAWVRVFPTLANVDGQDEPQKMVLDRVVKVQGDVTDTIDLQVSDEGYAFCHVGYVLNEGGGYHTGDLRLQTDAHRDFWFDADDGSNVLYLGMLRINTKTGDRNKLVDVRSAADIFASMERDAMLAEFAQGDSDEPISVVGASGLGDVFAALMRR